MVARLLDPEKRESSAALASIKRLVEHTKQFDGRMSAIRFMASPLEQISMSLFQASIAGEDPANMYGELAGRLATEPDALYDLSELIANVADEANGARIKYRNDLWQNIVLPLVPNAVSWSDVLTPSLARTKLLEGVKDRRGIPLIAAQILEEVLNATGITLSQSKKAFVLERVMKHFRWIVEFRNLTIEKLVQHGASFDARSRQNGVFDIHFCGASSSTARFNGAPVIAITDDSEVLEAARRADLGNRVMRNSTYDSILAGGQSSINAFARTFSQ